MKTTKEFRIRMVIALVVFICGVSLMGMIYIAFMQPEEYINPGIITSASPVASPVQSTRPSSSLFRANGAYQVARSSSTLHSLIPSGTIPTMKGVWTTSRSQIQSVGGGYEIGFNLGMSSNSQSSSSRGIQYSGSGSVVMPLTTFMALASSREVASPAAEQAPEMAKMAVAPHRAPPPPPVPNPGGGQLPGDFQLTEQPIGAPWVLAFFALFYAFAVYKGRIREIK